MISTLLVSLVCFSIPAYVLAPLVKRRLARQVRLSEHARSIYVLRRRYEGLR